MKIVIVLILVSAFIAGTGMQLSAQPEILSPDLKVTTVVSGLNVPTTMAFIGPDDILVLEKNTGLVKRVVNGVVQGIVLDLPVNFASERGLLGIALHPDFINNHFVYLYWTESTTGADSPVLSETPLLGNRVDRFIWNGTFLTFDLNLKRIRAIQADAGQDPRGNHNGGILKFGPDGKLYVFVGDLGRRGQMQNLPCGPTEICPGAPVPDDQFGGPEPDNAHFTGVVMRLNDDGSAPVDNPFYAVGAALGGEVGANIQKIYSYGHRNSFGMAFDPRSGALWIAENGDDSFSEINRLVPGTNGGWIQIMGPVQRINQFKEIETSSNYFGLQQLRWSPENIAGTKEEALSRLFMLPGAQYRDPEFSWKYEVAPAGIGFVDGCGLGTQFKNTLFVGAARDFLEGGNLFYFKLTGNRSKFAVCDPRLKDKVADNLDKWDITESDSLLIGRNFGVCTDIQTGPDSNLYVVSLTHGAIYEISSVVNLHKENVHSAVNSFTLSQNYPNPFNPSTTIQYSTQESGFVSLQIFDLLGREIAVLVNSEMEAGTYEVDFDASSYMSGIYFYKLTTASFTETKKMQLIK